MSGDYKKLLNKNKKKKFADPKNMGVDIDKNEYYEIILSNSAHPEKMNKNYWHSFLFKINLIYKLAIKYQWACGEIGRRTRLRI